MPPPKSVFTSHERNALKDRWGSQTTRLTRDSFLPFGSCQLCLLPSVDPVCCPQGDLFCRECAMTNLLAQRKEIKRLEKLAERLKHEDADQKAREEEEARVRAVEDFEAVQMGLSVMPAAAARGTSKDRRDENSISQQDQHHTDPTNPTSPPPKGTKRKFALDEEELSRIATSDLTTAKRTLAHQRSASKPNLPSFWIPTQTPTQHHHSPAPQKLSPTCPASSPQTSHSLSLKTLIPVHFHLERDTSASAATAAAPPKTPNMPTCPSCQKPLSNSTKASLAIPCGHVLCNPCVAKFLNPQHRHQRDAHAQLAEEVSHVLHCYVCDAELGGVGLGKAKKDRGREKEGEGKGKGKESRGRGLGLVEIRSEGTGFASAGAAVVRKEGVAFQV
ncbi:similar to RING finger domain protein [Plenodomus lingam JN3]|uniref:Similar to RING finger domain protein n=1 Tax=Leptosphaeria maculans (strain JN3 / isolate v23.1.3 / race Av1-4-5-6-7-8) TaxID=985895 RepID=E5A112_LEPMJ|nr:similar to RING finger domain protein [Plenodomus lingam JN3]CBX97308.1 similar to RING finger domain protein [Plenodomus lingam JN3]